MRRDEAAVVDIVAFAQRAQRRVVGVSAQRFASDEGMQDAVIRCLGVIGEAASRVSPEMRDAHPEVPWSSMIAMRNRLVHQYGAIDVTEVFRTATEDLSVLLRRAPTLLDRMHAALRARHYARRTEKAYCLWAERYIRFHKMRHPSEMGEAEINAFLTYLAVECKVSASTQNQALAGLLFLYRSVIGREVGDLTGVIRARKQKRLPVVLTREEVRALLDEMDGVCWLAVSVMYGTGLRLSECLTMRVQDVDFGRGQITVRDGKGGKDRITMLPESITQAGEAGSRPGPGRRLGAGAPARRVGAQVPERGGRMALAVGVPTGAPLAKRADGASGSAPHGPVDPAARGARGRAPRRPHEARQLPHAAALVRHASAGGGLRHPHHPGAAGPQGREHNDDLHPRAQQGWAWGAESVGRRRCRGRCENVSYRIQYPVKEIRQTKRYAKWFDRLRDRRARERIDAKIRRLSLGQAGDCAPVGEGVLELRIHCGPGYRVYFVDEGDAVVVLLAGGDKSTQSRDIRLAIALSKRPRSWQ
jgi:putative addiction module killer protein